MLKVARALCASQLHIDVEIDMVYVSSSSDDGLDHKEPGRTIAEIEDSLPQAIFEGLPSIHQFMIDLHEGTCKEAGYWEIVENECGTRSLSKVSRAPDWTDP